MPESSSKPLEQVFMQILHRLHRRWRAAICLPIAYVMGGLILESLYFQPARDGNGFYPLSDQITVILLFMGGSSIMVLWYLLARVRYRQAVELIPLREMPLEFERRALEYQLQQFVLCDLVAMPGIVLFLLNGSLFPLFAFAITSSIFYLRVLPSERLLGRAMFRPDLL